MRSIFRVGGRAPAFPPPEISSLRYEISTSPQGGGKPRRAVTIFANGIKLRPGNFARAIGVGRFS